MQIKGIGRTPLVGKDMDVWHAHGGANLEEAIREALWGEICHQVLPHGAVRILGVIATGTDTLFEGYEERGKGKRRLPRVLILREPALRPAHYMRATNFYPGENFSASLPTDAERTRSAIHSLPNGLAKALWPELAQPIRPTAQLLSDGLIAMVKRIASQQTAARAKRMPHGAINCSNIALDGRYIDFETMSAVTDYGRIILAKGNPDVWSEHTSLPFTLINLCFYIKNYSSPEVSAGLIDAESLIRIYNQHYQERLELEFLKLTGMPEAKLQLIEPQLRKDVWDCFFQLMQSGNQEPFKIPQMPPVMGKFHLNSIVNSHIQQLHQHGFLPSVAELTGGDNLGRRVDAALKRVIAAYQATFPVELQSLALKALAVHAARLNTTQLELCSTTLEKEIVETVGLHGEALGWVPGFIDQKLQRAVQLRADPPSCGLRWDDAQVVH